MPPGSDSYVALGWISAVPSALLLRVNAFDLASGALLTDWHAPPNAQLQNNPTLRCDGEYIGLALWGNDGDAPTSVVLAAGRNVTLFSEASPGSMFSVDIAITEKSPEGTSVVVAAAGKHVPANAFGDGGDAYGWMFVDP
jgi:hypothetical protein